MPDSTAPLIALVPSPLLGPRVWADVATVLRATGREVVAEQPRLPLAYFDAAVPTPDPGPLACGYLAFGPSHGDELARARAEGWPTEVLDGRHLHMLVDPDAVAAAVLRLELQVSPK